VDSIFLAFEGLSLKKKAWLNKFKLAKLPFLGPVKDPCVLRITCALSRPLARPFEIGFQANPLCYSGGVLFESIGMKAI
jgi:hypothetical protein